MAGSYNHCVIHDTGTEHDGKFAGVRLLDHLGDAYEALEEMYGMIWFLSGGNPEAIENARRNREVGLRVSPGTYPYDLPYPGEEDD